MTVNFEHKLTSSEIDELNTLARKLGWNLDRAATCHVVDAIQALYDTPLADGETMADFYPKVVDQLRFAYLFTLFNEGEYKQVKVRDGVLIEGMGVWYRAASGPVWVSLHGDHLAGAERCPSSYSIAKPEGEEVVTFNYKD